MKAGGSDETGETRDVNSTLSKKYTSVVRNQEQ
jgi:hypothetical protein